MKLSLTVTHTNGESATYITGLPEWAKWERKTGKSLYAMTGIQSFQVNDFLFLAHSAYVRANAGKPTKSYEIWELTVDECQVDSYEDPKAIPQEASTEASGS